MIEKYEDKWDWFRLSDNKSLPWSSELIEKYEDRWNWDFDYEYEDDFAPLYIGFGLGLPSKGYIPWSIELIEKFEDKWGWEHFSSNEHLPWSIELLVKFEDRWDWRFMYANEKVYEIFKPYLHDEFIEEMMLKITDQKD